MMKTKKCSLLVLMFTLLLAMTSCSLQKSDTADDNASNMGVSHIDTQTSNEQIFRQARQSRENTSVVDNENEVTFTNLDEQQLYEILVAVDSAANNYSINHYYYTDKEGIKEISGNSQLRRFTVDDETYYYNAFHYQDNTLILLYDDAPAAIGAIYYHDLLDPNALKQCATFKDVLDLDASLDSDFEFVSNHVVNAMNNSFDFNLDYDNCTLQATSDGLYAVQYEESLSGTEPSQNKIKSAERINHKVTDTLFQMLYQL